VTVQGRSDTIVSVGGCGPEVLSFDERVMLIYPDLHTWRYVDLSVRAQ
jgi:hypothetical protein